MFDRREFLAALAAGTMALLVDGKQVAAEEAEKTIEVKYVRAMRPREPADSDGVAIVEWRYPDGDWTRIDTKVTKENPVVWLDGNIGIDLSISLYGKEIEQ